MNMKWMKPNEGRLHKGNPFKRVEKSVKRMGGQAGEQAGRLGSQIEKEADRAGKNVSDSDWWEKTGTAALAGMADPAAWMTGMAGGGGVGAGAQAFFTGEATKEAWDAMTEADQAEARAAIEAEQARQEEARLMKEQEDAQREQERMTSERAREAEDAARERATRLGKGRSGLLYGTATGVKNKDVLGG